MPDLIPLTAIEDIVYAMLVAAADNGEASPANRVIADRLGILSKGSASNVVRSIERKGWIRVESGSKWRIVTVVATGRRTVKPVFKCDLPHEPRRRTYVAPARPAHRRRVQPTSLPPARAGVRLTAAAEPLDGPAALRAAIFAEVSQNAYRRALAQTSNGASSALLTERSQAIAIACPLELHGRDRRPVAPCREPCLRCGARGDIGCAHQRPDPAWAPHAPSAGHDPVGGVIASPPIGLVCPMRELADEPSGQNFAMDNIAIISDAPAAAPKFEVADRVERDQAARLAERARWLDIEQQRYGLRRRGRMIDEMPA